MLPRIDEKRIGISFFQPSLSPVRFVEESAERYGEEEMLASQKTPQERKAVRAVRPVIHAERCKGCGICTVFCPDRVLAIGDELNSYGYPFVGMTGAGTCRGCLRCCMMCPDVVFTFDSEEAGPCSS